MIHTLENNYITYKENSLSGLQIISEDIKPLLIGRKEGFSMEKIGESELNIDINSITIGEGDVNILIWTQMHGNESTGTKAIFDLLNFLENPAELYKERDLILKECTLTIVPMLNPDGAKLYTRKNANNIDLNRDAVSREAIESQVLYDICESVKPNYCFNMHDQRSIFNVGNTNKSAVMSFLAPSVDIERTVTESRKDTMRIISSINENLQKILPGMVGRYTDEFYPNATGDNFQKRGYNTILVESGYYPKDYDREISRMYTFCSVVLGLFDVSKKNKGYNYELYNNIPQNGTKYFDIIKRGEIEDIAYQYEYSIKKDKLSIDLKEVNRGDLSKFIGHNE